MERGQTPTRRVLVVEDDPTTRELLVELLAGEGHDVRVACDGLEGLAQAQEFRPDVILLDLLLPRMDGRDFLIAYRASAGGSGVVILSGAMDLDVPLADAVIAKPFAVDDVLRAVAAAPSRGDGASAG